MQVGNIATLLKQKLNNNNELKSFFSEDQMNKIVKDLNSIGLSDIDNTSNQSDLDLLIEQYKRETNIKSAKNLLAKSITKFIEILCHYSNKEKYGQENRLFNEAEVKVYKATMEIVSSSEYYNGSGISSENEIVDKFINTLKEWNNKYSLNV
ncbi:hypothetical protein [Chryseobacterium sp. MYb328]|uniref:hypothetical protein n=1 Tax=Chryseobacterium sp. MYb328 TaxID=2745231 RepID=UPI0030AF7E34